MNIRTDLAVEARELHGRELPAGVRESRDTVRGTLVERVEVLSREGAEALGKPEGTYVTLTPPRRFSADPQTFEDAALTLAENLRALLGGVRGTVLCAGLGNALVTPDSLGPLTVRRLLVTRHLVDAAPEHFGGFRRVAAVETGVTGTTGLESSELVASLVRAALPEAVIAVDALAARKVERLCATVQLSDTGVTPGSGVGNSRRALTRETLGVPVIAVGVPTVVDAATLASDLFGADADGISDLFVTPRDVDARVEEMAKLVGAALNMALQDGISFAEALTN